MFRLNSIAGQFVKMLGTTCISPLPYPVTGLIPMALTGNGILSMILLSVNQDLFCNPACKIKAISGMADLIYKHQAVANIHFFIFPPLVTLSVNNLPTPQKGSTGWWFSPPKAPHPRKNKFLLIFLYK